MKEMMMGMKMKNVRCGAISEDEERLVVYVYNFDRSEEMLNSGQSRIQK